MPAESPLVRQWVLLRTLCARHYGATIREMADELAVSQKTIRRDLETFQAAGFPLEETVGDRGLKRWRIDSAIIKGYTSPAPFLEAVQSQLDGQGIRGEPSLVAQPQLVTANQDRPGGTHSPYLRRTIRIRDKEIVGFALRVEGLNAEESIALQEAGIGGRRRFGCGMFIPDRK